MVLPKEQRIQAPQEGSPERGSCTRKRSPQNIWHWRSVGLIFKRTTGLWVIETPLLKGINKTLHTVRLRGSDLKGTLDISTCWSLQRLSVRQETIKTQPGHMHAAATMLGSSFYSRTLTLIRVILKSFLEVISGRTQFHPPAPRNLHGWQDLTISWAETQPLLPACPQKLNRPQQKDRCSPHTEHHQNI